MGSAPAGSGVTDSRRARLVVAAIWLVGIAAAGVWALTRDGGAGAAAADLVDAIQGSAWGPVVFVAVYLARPLIFFSATVLTVAGGFLFGPVGGIILVVIAANGSALVAYGLARWLGGEKWPDPEAAGRLARWTRKMRDRSFETIIVMRLLYLPYDLVSYLAGAARIHLGAFVAATAIGSAPATVAFVLFGASLESFDGGVPTIDAPILITSAVLMVAGLVVSKLLRRREEGPDAVA